MSRLHCDCAASGWFSLQVPEREKSFGCVPTNVKAEKSTGERLSLRILTRRVSALVPTGTSPKFTSPVSKLIAPPAAAVAAPNSRMR